MTETKCQRCGNFVNSKETELIFETIKPEIKLVTLKPSFVYRNKKKKLVVCRSCNK